MLTITDHNGIERALGNVQAARLTHPCRTYGDGGTWMIARRNWPDMIGMVTSDLDHHRYLPPVHDQGSIGQCNAEACAAAVEYCRAAAGLPYVQLSPGDLYARINRGVDRGSLLEDGLAEAEGAGIGTAATCGLLWRRGMPLATAEERGRYRVLERWLCPTFDHCMAAVLCGFAVVAGVLWHDTYTPDGDGWLPGRGAGRAGGHALVGYAPAMRGACYGIWCQNSWGAGWGLDGRCVLPETAFAGPVGGWWAVRQVVTESGDLPPLKVA